jgi:RNA polymerase sigma-70 factor (ECF subfamily)
VTATSAPLSLDLERMRRAGQGDPKAQAWLATTVLAGVRRVARAILRRPADADDAAQLALMEVLRSASSYRGDAPVEAWARRITVRTVLRHARRERRGDIPTDAQEMTAAVETPEPPLASMSEELPREVRAYLDELPEAQRDAIVLHHALGYSLDEIAELSEVSPETIKSRIRLGTATLRKQVRQDIASGRRRSS